MAGRNRTCGAPRFRRALYRLSYGHAWWAARPPSIPLEVGDRCSGERRHLRYVAPSRRRRCFPSHSLTLRPWIADRRLREREWSPSYVEELWSRTLGPFRKIAAQIEQISATQLIRERVEPFSLERGLDPSSCFSSWASPSSLVRHRSPPKQRRRPIRVAHERSRSAPCHLAHAALLEGSHGPRPV